MSIAILTGASAGLGKSFFRSLQTRHPDLDGIWLNFVGVNALAAILAALLLIQVGKEIKRREKLMESIKEYRQKNENDEFGIACGYATFDAEIDKDIEETRHRADLSMYENKKEIKGSI